MTPDASTAGMPEPTIAQVREFNRFITRRIGVLREGLLHSPYSLTEARILFELGQRVAVTASELSSELGLDPGYLSRVLSGLDAQGLLHRQSSAADGRKRVITLTASGGEAFALLDRRSHDEVAEMLSSLTSGERDRLLAAMGQIQSILTQSYRYAEPFFLRDPEPGDMGWVVQSHGVLYAREYGWDARFEALVAEIVAGYVQHHEPTRERCWIAEMAGDPVGCVFVVRQSDEVAKLRLLLVDPQARGLGLGSRLVDECIRFARLKGYTTLTLWTNSVLDAARRIYESKGFALVEEEPHHSFGKDLVGQNWELRL